MQARLKLLAIYPLYWLGFFAAIRLVFLAAEADRSLALPISTITGTFWHGLGLDLSAAAYLCLIPFLLIALSPGRRFASWPARLLLPYTTAATATLSLLAAADLEVFQHWGRRIDASVLPYLTHPVEAWASAGGGPRELILVLALGLTFLFVRLAARLLRPLLLALPPARPVIALPLMFCALALVIPARGGLQLIPINQSSAYFSDARFANQAALNVGWNFFDSWRRGLNRRTNPYAVMPMDSARAVVARARSSRFAQGDSALLSTDRPNILLIVWESLSARGVERLGGVRGVTPEFDHLAASGLLFRHFYAAGDHTEKGLAALLAGVPTIPDASILRVPEKAASLPSLSKDLTAAGYHTAFYYGGELGFGNLRIFARDGGFERVLGKSDFARSSWSSKWGAHDEAVAARLRGDLRGLPMPFFVTWLTLSSHEPFEVPGPARIPGREAERRFLNSLAYTDHVLGDFLRQAEKEPWWARTLVVIVADHSKPLERTDADVPYKSAESWYHIPMLWTGGALARRGRTLDQIGGQTDLPPTLLGRLGLPAAGRYRFGRDLFAPAETPVAFYAFDDGFGLVTERGSFVWERSPDRVSSQTGPIAGSDLRLGRALLQLAYQDYLDR